MINMMSALRSFQSTVPAAKASNARFGDIAPNDYALSIDTLDYTPPFPIPSDPSQDEFVLSHLSASGHKDEPVLEPTSAHGKKRFKI